MTQTRAFLLAAAVAASAALALPATAAETVLFDEIDQPVQTDTPLSFDFVAESTSTTIGFAGYDTLSFEWAMGIVMTAAGNPANLLGQTFTLTPAACGSYAHPFGSGAYGTDNLEFGGACEGSYDTFTQTVATAVGASYTLSLLFSVGDHLGDFQPNGFRVSATDVRVSGPAPEPAAWALMLLGFGAAGAALRRRRGAAPSPSSRSWP